MIIKPYGDLPRTYAPDIGEVVEARLSESNPWVRAVVTFVSRRRNGDVRVNFVWLGTDGACTAVKGGRSHVQYHPVDGPPLIKQIDGGRAVQP